VDWPDLSHRAPDITAFSAHRRSDEDRLILRRTMYDMLQRAFEAAGLMWRELHTEDRGDGTLIVVPPDTPASAVAARALGQLAAALRRHNQSASDALRMQLRVALHAGPVIRDAQGVTGHAINQTARLVQARILRKRLTETRADLGVIVSAYIYDYVIRQHKGQPMDATPYRKIRYQVKESALTAWIHLTGAASE
jgi:class 3 adenylate cyclase